jgi:hypothetical protein
VNLSDSHRISLGARAKKCTFVGYNGASLAYLVYDKSTGKVLSTGHVEFNEPDCAPHDGNLNQLRQILQMSLEPVISVAELEATIQINASSNGSSAVLLPDRNELVNNSTIVENSVVSSNISAEHSFDEGEGTLSDFAIRRSNRKPVPNKLYSGTSLIALTDGRGRAQPSSSSASTLMTFFLAASWRVTSIASKL